MCTCGKAARAPSAKQESEPSRTLFPRRLRPGPRGKGTSPRDPRRRCRVSTRTRPGRPHAHGSEPQHGGRWTQQGAVILRGRREAGGDKTPTVDRRDPPPSHATRRSRRSVSLPERTSTIFSRRRPLCRSPSAILETPIGRSVGRSIDHDGTSLVRDSPSTSNACFRSATTGEFSDPRSERSAAGPRGTRLHAVEIPGEFSPEG